MFAFIIVTIASISLTEEVILQFLSNTMESNLWIKTTGEYK